MTFVLNKYIGVAQLQDQSLFRKICGMTESRTESCISALGETFTDFDSLVTNPSSAQAACLKEVYTENDLYVGYNFQVGQCYCTSYAYEPDKPTKSGPRGGFPIGFPDEEEDVTGETDDLSIPSASIQEKRIADSTTSTQRDKEVIPVLFGKTTVGGTILWIDDPIEIDSTSYTPAFSSNGPSITHNIETCTNLIISVGRAVPGQTVSIDNIRIGDSSLSSSSYSLLDETYIANGDYNASKYLPLYKDQIIILIEDVPYTRDFSDISVTVVVYPQATQSEVFTSTVTVPSSSRIQKISNSLIAFKDGSILNTSSSLQDFNVVNSFTVPDNNVSWWHLDGNNFYYYLSNTQELRVLDSVTSQDDLLYTGNISPIGFMKGTAEVAFIDGGKVRTVSYTGLDFTSTVVSAFSGDTYIDMFTDSGELYRYWPANNAGLSVNIINSPVEVIRTGRHYIVFHASGIDIYLKNSMIYLWTIQGSPALPVARAEGQIYDSSDVIYSTSQGAKRINLNTMSITSIQGCPIPLMQFNTRQLMKGVLSSNKFYSCSLTDRSSDVNSVSIGSILDFAEYPQDSSSLQASFVEGYVYKEYDSLVDEVRAVYGIPYVHNTIPPVEIVNERFTKIHINSQKDPVDYARITYAVNSSTAELEGQLEYNVKEKTTENVYTLDTSFFLTYEQAYLIIANAYARRNEGETKIQIETGNLDRCVGDIVTYLNNDYVLTSEKIGRVITYEGHKVPINEITTAVPEVVVPSFSPSILIPQKKTKIFNIPVPINTIEKYTFAYTGDRPEALFKRTVNEVCASPKKKADRIELLVSSARNLVSEYSASVRSAALDITGSLSSSTKALAAASTSANVVSVPASPMVEFGKLVNTDPIQVQFHGNMTGRLADLSYEQLLEDRTNNLVFVGREAIQFQSHSIAPDGKTVTFTDVLRGRLDTGFFVPFHKLEEDVFVYSADTIGTFSSKRPTAVLYASPETFEVFDGELYRYEGQVEVSHVEQNGNVVSIRVVTDSSSPVSIILCDKPYAFAVDRTPYIDKVTALTTSTFDLESRFSNRQPVMWYAYSKDKYPAYGFLRGRESALLTTSASYAILQN